VSHNLRSYANNLKAILELFATASSEKEKQMLFHHLQSISKGFSATIGHLNQIVEIQNLNTLRLESINLHDYVDNIIQILGVQVQACHAVIQNKINADAEILANPAYMESILLNLLTNAIKYRDPDRRLLIELTSVQREDGLELCVKDNGLGINLEKYGKDIFGMYKTFHKNADAKGIGLFITKLQVEAMQGTIAVQSEEHIGTTFIIHFSRQLTQ
jgi:signal transduction histidine kinase